MAEPLILELAVVLAGSALLAVAAHFLRQPLIIAYIAAGVLLGPRSPVPGLALVQEEAFVRGTGELGLVLLLFLLGLVLHPERLLRILRTAGLVTLGTAAVFFGVGFGVALGMGAAIEQIEVSTGAALLVGCAVMFSSTLLVVKLLPTRRLHESEVGTLAIGVLVIQDILAILVLLGMALASDGAGASGLGPWLRLPLGVTMLAGAFPFERRALRPLMRRIEPYPELVFVLSLAWCLALAEGAEVLGFSKEIGAFVAGLALARNPLSLYIWEKVQPLRDFFIVLLFFSLGALVDVGTKSAAPLALAGVLAVALAAAKPLVFSGALRLAGTRGELAREAGWRLGQSSEFALVIAMLALDRGLIGRPVFDVILVTVLLGFLLSTYAVVWKYPTPLGLTTRMHQT